MSKWFLNCIFISGDPGIQAEQVEDSRGVAGYSVVGRSPPSFLLLDATPHGPGHPYTLRPHTGGYCCLEGKLKTAVVWLGIVFAAGLLRLFFYWMAHLMVRATHTLCNLVQADIVVLRVRYKADHYTSCHFT